ncbi:rhodanese-like domain-containing protein [Nocardioides sp.]|uniref:rhodanese-like domain-containing protein n=1 Tax=Nocardioides sp. TaxID=35761 RepID=UPI0037850B18
MTALISRDELASAIEAGEVVVLDALPAAYYEQQHLPGALNLVDTDVATQAPTLLPDKTASIVTYCSNASCNNSQAVAGLLERAGYTNVRKYRDGIEDWVGAGLPTETGPGR